MLKVFLMFALYAFSYLPQKACSESNYFSNPCLYSSEELAQELKEKELDMCWHFGPDSHFCFVSKNDEICFEICLGTLPDIYDDLIARIQNKFIQEKESKRLIFSYKIKNEREEINLNKMLKRNVHPKGYSYLVADRRIIEKAPQVMSKEKLAEIIEFKRILFYTGAGISALEVPAMDELNKLLGLQINERFLFSLENALNNPREFAFKIRAFHKACLFSIPTKAHLALKELAVLKNTRIITENLDCLHEASGIFPYRVDAKHLREEIGGESLAQFDYVIAIGLKLDDRGFLGWYKKHNPQGKIIAINLTQPSYLGDEDFLVAGDLQEIIPAINARINRVVE